MGTPRGCARRAAHARTPGLIPPAHAQSRGAALEIDGHDTPLSLSQHRGASRDIWTRVQKPLRPARRVLLPVRVASRSLSPRLSPWLERQPTPLSLSISLSSLSSLSFSRSRVSESPTVVVLRRSASRGRSSGSRGFNGLEACRRATREATASRCAACISHRWVPPPGST